MPTLVHEFDWPDRVVVGTVGRPGSRTFYLQVRTGARVSSVALEKEQSALLAEKIDELLEQLGSDASNGLSIPADTPVELIDDDPLDQPVEEQFRTGTMRLGWDPSTAQVVIEAYPYVDAPDDADDASVDPDPVEPSEMLLVRIPVGTARAFVRNLRWTHATATPRRPVTAAGG